MRVFGGLLSRVFSKVSKRTFTRAGGGRRFLYSTSREQKTVVVDGTTVVPQQSALDSLSSSAFLIDWTFQHNTHFYTFCTKEKFLPQFFFFFCTYKKRSSSSVSLSRHLSFALFYSLREKKEEKEEKEKDHFENDTTSRRDCPPKRRRRDDFRRLGGLWRTLSTRALAFATRWWSSPAAA